jgi:hypothetical protein
VNLDLQVVPQFVWCHQSAGMDSELVETRQNLIDEPGLLSLIHSTSRQNTVAITYSHIHLRPGTFQAVDSTESSPSKHLKRPSMMHAHFYRGSQCSGPLWNPGRRRPPVRSKRSGILISGAYYLRPKVDAKGGRNHKVTRTSGDL